MTSLMSYVDEVDVQIEKLQKLIEAGSRLDPELGAGLGCTESVGGIQKKIDRAAAGAEELDAHMKELRRRRQ